MTGLVVWTVYRSTADFPGKFVVREFQVVQGEIYVRNEPAAVRDTLEEVRSVIPRTCVRVERSLFDHRAIEEVWV